MEELKKTGAPVDWVPLDPWFVYPIGIAVTAKNSHPAATRLYIDFILSDEGQTSIRQLSRIPARKDVLPNPPKLMQGCKLFVIKPASSAIYNKYNGEMLRYFRGGDCPIRDGNVVRNMEPIPAPGRTLGSGPAPGEKPDDEADYQNNQNDSHPDAGLKNVSDQLTAGQSHRRNE